MTLHEKFDSITEHIESLIGQGEYDVSCISEMVSKITGLNQRLLGDVFQFITDISLARYIRQRRLVQALWTRIECELPLEDVCEDAGYSDAAAFSKACKTCFGYSPAQITAEILKKYSPLSFAGIISGKNANQLERDELIEAKNDTICGVSPQQFAEIKQVLELGAIYGFTDEEAGFVHRIATNQKLLVTKVAEFYDDFKLQIESGSNIPCLNLYDMAEIACRYDLSYSEAQAIMYELSCHGYLSIQSLPEGFFDIYFSEENTKHGWYVPYICEIAEALDQHGLSTYELDDIAFHASMFGIDMIEAIENYQEYEDSWDNMVDDALRKGIPEDDTIGFGYRSTWELDEE